MMRGLLCIISGWILFGVCVVAQETNCRFSFDFTSQELWENPVKQEEFLNEVMYWEGNFAKHLVGLNRFSGLTYDGHGIDYSSGLPNAGYLHFWSAPSKESIHLIMLAKALQGNSMALRFTCNECKTTIDQLSHAIDLLTRKMKSYQLFNQQYPGFAGFLPWFDVDDSGCYPNDGWTNQVPGLDNGEWVWGLRAVAYELDRIGEQELAQEYLDYWDMLARNAMMVFYAGAGRIRAVTLIHNSTASPSADNYYQNVPCGRNCYLDDPYEGEMMTFFMTLYGNWSGIESEREDVWKLKRIKLRAVNYQLNPPTVSETQNITVQEGWWFSSHEQWKYLELPYFDSEINKRVFFNGERARTWNSVAKGYPGMFASVTDVIEAPNENPNYLSAAGIPSIAFQPVEKFTTITPYSTFPLFLTGNFSVALLWYQNMLQGPSMQNRFGSTESCNVTGSAISPVLTWDSKITTLCGMLGGISDITRIVLQRDGKYDEFVSRVDYEWNRVFPVLEGEHMDFALPTVAIPYPSSLGDFSTCQMK